MSDILEYLPFTDQTEFPVEKIVLIGKNNYRIEVHYNDRMDFYTFILKDIDDNIILTNKVCYLSQLIGLVIEGFSENLILLPIDMAQEASDIPIHDHVGIENFDKIRLALIP